MSAAGPATSARASVVLLHGLGMSASAWKPVLPALQAHHNVVTPTLPGHRGGPAPARPVTIAGLADAVQRHLDEQGFHRPHVVGNSLGGWVALELARRGIARSVVALSPAGAWRHAIDLARLDLNLRVGGLSLANPLLRSTMWSPLMRRAALRGLMEHAERMTAADAVELLKDMRGCTVLGDVMRIGRREGRLAAFVAPDCPTHLAWGQRDRVIPFRAHGRPLLRVLPWAEHSMIPRAGHVPMYDAPERVVDLILRTTSRTDGAQR